LFWLSGQMEAAAFGQKITSSGMENPICATITKGR
jgi:hypothetical protein